ncbi:hypothetical protein SPURM210S_03911 [Streptomyces purpurascens]
MANEVPERIAHLVYLDAMVPDAGEAAVDVQPMTQNLIDLAAKSDNGWRIPPLPRWPVRSHRPADVAWLRATLSDQPVRCLRRPVRLDKLCRGLHSARTHRASAPRRKAVVGRPVRDTARRFPSTDTGTADRARLQ